MITGGALCFTTYLIQVIPNNWNGIDKLKWNQVELKKTHCLLLLSYLLIFDEYLTFIEFKLY